jgi:hypothetical protein
MSYQNYEGGTIFEILLQVIFAHNNISISLKPYEAFPALQNEGIDAVIMQPEALLGKTIQVKMFKKTFQYGTFPWEVARFLIDKQTHVDEPHQADFHVIIDPVEEVNDMTRIKLLVFKTSQKIAQYYKNKWEAIIASGNVPPTNRHLNEAESKYWIEEGLYEKAFKFLQNKDIYQLKLPHTAYQRNVRCRWRNDIPHRLEMQYFLPSKYIRSVTDINSLTKEAFLHYQNNSSTINNTLKHYLTN